MRHTKTFEDVLPTVHQIRFENSQTHASLCQFGDARLIEYCLFGVKLHDAVVSFIYNPASVFDNVLLYFNVCTNKVRE